MLHLDPTYARNVEGHRNLLVHGPLTLTLMLQVLDRHISDGERSPAVVSIEYRNLAPLYCDEAMRVCVKKRKVTETASVWDVWIEGPTGGMAVKAVAHTAHTVERGGNPSPTETDVPGVEPNPPLPQDRLNTELGRMSRQERRSLERLEKKDLSLYSRAWRKKWIGKALRYLYMDISSPLLCPVDIPRRRIPARLSARVRYQEVRPSVHVHPRPENFATSAPSAEPTSLLSPVEHSSPSEPPTVQEPRISSIASAPPSSPPVRFSLAQRQRAVLLANRPPPSVEAEESNKAEDSNMQAEDSIDPKPLFRKIEKETSPLWHIRNGTQRGAAEQGEETIGRADENSAEPFKRTLKRVIKVDLPSVRKSDIALTEAARKRAHQKRIQLQEREAAKKLSADAETAGEEKKGAE